MYNYGFCRFLTSTFLTVDAEVCWNIQRRDEAGGWLMKRLLTTLVILKGLIGGAGAVWADSQGD